MLIEPESGDDPRLTLSKADLESASARAAPQVARGGGHGLGLAAGMAAALVLGAFTFLSLSHARAASAESEPPPAPAPVLAAAPAAAPPAIKEAALYAAPSRAMPMVIDNSGDPDESALGGKPSAESADQNGAAFSLRAANQDSAAQASQPGDLSSTIVEGTLIPAVLETALNSDLPGYTRAIVSRDVKSFDGSAVLIPRGSRLIGQYRGVAQPGQSRAFVVWSRLIRPDGVSIDLASPALDDTGAVGLSGSVNHHFIARYGSAILLSVVGAVPAIGSGGSSTVVIGLNGAAQSAAAQAAQSNGRIPPTIKVPVGTPIQVFTARDLHF